MSGKTAIEWATDSWNPIRHRWRAEGAQPAGHYCQKISTGCDNCYAGRLQPRFYAGADYAPASGYELRFAEQLVATGGIYLDDAALAQLAKWRQPRRIFVGSMTDLFGEWVPSAWHWRIWDAMRAAPQHTFMILTKRPVRMRTFVGLYTAPLPNVWLGVTVESDAYTWRAKQLAEIPAAVRFVSAEPLLGPLPSLDLGATSWLIAGGESGGPVERRLLETCPYRPCVGFELDLGDGSPPRRGGFCGACGGTGWAPRPDALVWARDLRDRAQAAGVAFFWKQWGGSTPKQGGRLLDGREWNAVPTPRVAVPA